MIHLPRLGELTPTKISMIYVIVGGGWILSTDYLVSLAVVGAPSQQWLQTIKGLLYVGGSAALVFWLARYREKELTRVNNRLQRAIQQNSIFHRILRHNLRNVCNIIEGNTRLLQEEVGANPRLDRIRDQTAGLVELIEKTRHLRDALQGDSDSISRVDLVEEVKGRVEVCRIRYPDAEITMDLPETAWVSAFSSHVVIQELIENAIEHNDSDDPSVHLSVSTERDGSVEFVVRDNGPGIPALERNVFHRDREGPLSHSQGVGLWVARTLVAEAGGSVTFDDVAPHGSVVRVTLSQTAPPTPD